MLILCTSLSLVAALYCAASGSEHRVLVATDTIRAVPHRWGEPSGRGLSSDSAAGLSVEAAAAPSTRSHLANATQDVQGDCHIPLFVGRAPGAMLHSSKCCVVACM